MGGGDILSFYELWWGMALKRLGNTALRLCLGLKMLFAKHCKHNCADHINLY